MSSTRPGQSTFTRLNVTSLKAEYLQIDDLPIRSKGQPITLAEFANTPGYITSSAIVQSDLSVTDPGNPAFVKGQRQLAAIAYTGNASDLIGSIPATATQADWSQQDTTSAAFIRDRPVLSAVATQGRYDSLLPGTGQPVVPLVADASITAASGTSIPVINLPVVPQQQYVDWASVDPNSLATIRNRPQLAAIATSGNWQDLQGRPVVYDSVDWNLLQNSGSTLAIRNPPVIPPPQVNASWTATTGVAAILNRPTTAQLQQQILVQADMAVTDPTSYAFVAHQPTIPPPQVATDWLATSGVTQLMNRPTLGKVATSNLYGDLTGLPTIPAAQVPVDWQSSSGVTAIANRPQLAAVATSGRYGDLLANSGQPVVPTVVDWAASSSGGTTLSVINKPAFAQPQQANWLETDSSQLDYIRSKPQLSTVAMTGNYSDLLNVPAAAAAQQQADYGETDSTKVTFIKRRPALATVALSGRFDDLVANTGQPPSYQYADWTATSSGNGALMIRNQPQIPPAQVQSDFAQTDSTQLSYIRNAPRLAMVATSGSYGDLSNTPTIPVQQNSDWGQTDTTKFSYILNKPTLSAVATSGRYDALLTGSGQPVVPSSVSWTASSSTAGTLAVTGKPTSLSAFTNDPGYYSAGSDVSVGALTASGAVQFSQGATTTTLSFSTSGVTGFDGTYGKLSGVPTNLSQFSNDLAGSTGGWNVPGTLSCANVTASGPVTVSAPSTQQSGVYTTPVTVIWAGMNAGDPIGATFGQAASSLNRGELYFVYAASGSASNRARMGLFGVDGVSVWGSGNVGVNVGTAAPAQQLTVAGTFSASGAASFGGAVSAVGAISGPVQASTLAASGAATLGGSLSVTGATTVAGLSSTGTISGAVQATTLGASGAAMFSSTVNVGGTLLASGVQCASLTSTGNISGPVQATTLTASGATSLQGALTVGGALTMANDQNVLLSTDAWGKGGIHLNSNVSGASTSTDFMIQRGGIAAEKDFLVIHSANTQGCGIKLGSSNDLYRMFVDCYTGFVGINKQTPQAYLDVNGNAAISGDTALASTLEVAGAATLAGALSVSGATTAAAVACTTLTASGAVSAGTLNVSGTTTLGAIASNGLQITTTASGQTGVKVYGPGNGGATVAIDWSTFTPNSASPLPCWRWLLTDSGSGSSTLALQVAPSGQSSSSALATALTFAAGTGAATFAQPLSVSAATTLGGTLSVSGATTAAGVTCSSLTTSGTATVNAMTVTNLTVGSSLTCVPNATFNSNVSVNQGLTVTAATTLGGPVAVGGALTMANDQNVLLSTDAWGKGGIHLNSAISGASTSTDFMIQRGGIAAEKDFLVIHSANTQGAAIKLGSSGDVYRMLVDCYTGFVGINKQSPQAYLDVNGNAMISASNTLPLFVQLNGTTATNGVALELSCPVAGDIGLCLNQAGVNSAGIVQRSGSSGTGNAGRLAFVQNLYPGNAGTEQMCIQQNGYVGINTTQPSAQLSVAGTFTASASAALTGIVNTGTISSTGAISGPIAATTVSASGAATLSGVANTGTISSTGAISGPVAATTLSASGAATLSGTLAVTGTSAFTGNVTLLNSSSTSLSVINSAGSGSTATINMAGYNTWTNGAPLLLQGQDNNYSCDFVVLSKPMGSPGSSAAVERFRVSATGTTTLTSNTTMTGTLASGVHNISGVDGSNRSIVSLASGNSQNTIVWGQALSSNNSAYLTYNNATTSNVQVGIYGGTPLSVDANGSTKVAQLLVGNSTDTTRQISCLQSGMSTGTINYITVGQSNSNNNQTEIAFSYSASGSSSNKATLGLFGQTPVSVDGSSNLNVPGRLTSSTRFSVHLFNSAALSIPASTAVCLPPGSYGTGYFSTNTTTFSTSISSLINSSGYFVVPATGVWALQLIVNFPSNGSSVSNQVWFINTAGSTDVSSSGLYGNTNQRLGIQATTQSVASAVTTTYFAAGDVVAPAIWSNTAQTTASSTAIGFNITLVTLLT